MWEQLWWLWSRPAPRSRRPSWPASWSQPPRSRPGEELVRLGRLPGVGFRGSRPGKAAQCSECLEARRPDNFFRRTRGSRLGYPWPFTPTVVPEADWASRWSGVREARSASYRDKPAARSRPRCRRAALSRILLESGGGNPQVRAPGRGPASGRWRATWQESLPAHARDGTSPQGGGPPRPRPGPGADPLYPETARTFRAAVSARTYA